MAPFADEIEALTCPLVSKGFERFGATATVPRRSCARPSCCVIVMAWRLQAEALGGLDRDTCDASSSAASGSRQKVLSSGSGPRCGVIGEGGSSRITVEEDGFRHEGRLFKSLSETATAIAGTRWNGPRFFGLRSAK